MCLCLATAYSRALKNHILAPMRVEVVKWLAYASLLFLLLRLHSSTHVFDANLNNLDRWCLEPTGTNNSMAQPEI